MTRKLAIREILYPKRTASDDRGVELRAMILTCSSESEGSLKIDLTSKE